MLTANDSAARETVTPGPWNARDTFVAETAIKIDRLHAKLARLEKQNDQLKTHVADLLDNARQASRFQAFAESLRNARELKLDNMQRSVKELKGRIDLIEGPASAVTSHRSFDTVSADLTELAKRLRTLEHISLATAATIAFVAFAAGSVATHLLG